MIAGRYSLDSVVGRGGMGVVWRGEDQVLGRDVAVKRVGMVPGGVTADLARAEREARLAASLAHSHVVTIFDLVDEGDEQWLVMEYVDGATLTELVRQQGPLDADAAAKLLSQAADALAAAHRAGIVHRDVKPSNVLVTPTGQVKITDFGIARGSTDATLTQTGLMSGSPAYLAPEVASGSSASPASDVWSLGATLFHAVTGAPPYDATGNLVATLYRIVHEDPPRPRDPGWLTPVFEATMTKDPAARWTMAQVRDFLDTRTLPTEVPASAPRTPATYDASPRTLIAAPPPLEPVAGRARVPWWVWVAAAVLAAALVTFVVVSRTGGPSAGDRAAGHAGSGHHASPSTGASSTTTPTSTPTSTPTTRATPGRPTATAMRAFVTDYLATVTRNPAQAWGRLTPQFQAASGGLHRYRGFWSTISSAQARDIVADPAGHSVSYTVHYTRTDGSTSTGQVTLRLVGGGSGLRIAGEG
ncbi:MAG: eukaryotic-like serine/threonine-protein kinase [Nocardioidaceae bacterium]|nr:eukaryotic-like serine/threonine-protein kinase [Nocardioidaceae bacterium]